MFDVSFSELMVIAVVALIVIGPEKLPKVARMLGHLTGRVQRYVANVKEDINREMQFEDLQKLQQEIKQTVENTQKNLQNQVSDFEADFNFHQAESQPQSPPQATSQPVMIGSTVKNHAVLNSPKKLVKRPRKPRIAKSSDTVTPADITLE